MAKIVKEFDLGVIGKNFEADDLATLLGELTSDEIQQYKENANAAAEILSASTNISKIREIVEQLCR